MKFLFDDDIEYPMAKHLGDKYILCRSAERGILKQFLDDLEYAIKGDELYENANLEAVVNRYGLTISIQSELPPYHAVSVVTRIWRFTCYSASTSYWNLDPPKSWEEHGINLPQVRIEFI